MVLGNVHFRKRSTGMVAYILGLFSFGFHQNKMVGRHTGRSGCRGGRPMLTFGIAKGKPRRKWLGLVNI